MSSDRFKVGIERAETYEGYDIEELE